MKTFGNTTRFIISFLLVLCPLKLMAQVPTAPTNVEVAAGNQSATIYWTAPASIGGSPILLYLAEDVSNNALDCISNTGSPITTSCTITGLTNGQSYTFEVYAVNNTGMSPISTPSSAVIPPGDTLLVTPNPLNFGNVKIGQTISGTITIQNKSGSTGTLAGNIFSENGNMPLASGNMDTYSLAPGHSQSATFNFTPTISGTPLGQFTTGIYITNYSANEMPNYAIPAIATVLKPDTINMVINNSSITFNTTPVGQAASSTLLITNQSNSNDTLFDTVSIVGSSDYSIINNTVGPDSLLKPGQTQAVQVQFIPSSINPKVDTLYLKNNSTNMPNHLAIPLIGIAVKPGALSVTPSYGFNASEIHGGLYSSTDVNYTLKDTGGSSLIWKMTNSQPWLTYFPDSGNLGPSDSVQIDAYLLNSTSVTNMPPGTYLDTIHFINTLNGIGNTIRPMSLMITTASEILKGENSLPQIGLDKDGTLLFSLPQRIEVNIEIYDSQGQVISQVLNESRDAGSYSIILPANLKGSYDLLDFRAGDYHQTLKVGP